MLHSDSPYTNHKAHNGAAKSVRERLSFSTEEQAHPRTLPVQFTKTAGREEKEKRVFCNKLFGLKVRTVPCDRIQQWLGILIKLSDLVGNETDVLLFDCYFICMLHCGTTGNDNNSYIRTHSDKLHIAHTCLFLQLRVNNNVKPQLKMDFIFRWLLFTFTRVEFL